LNPRATFAAAGFQDRAKPYRAVSLQIEMAYIVWAFRPQYIVLYRRVSDRITSSHYTFINTRPVHLLGRYQPPQPARSLRTTLDQAQDTHRAGLGACAPPVRSFASVRYVSPTDQGAGIAMQVVGELTH
jgi:hypothetical protein